MLGGCGEGLADGRLREVGWLDRLCTARTRPGPHQHWAESYGRCRLERLLRERRHPTPTPPTPLRRTNPSCAADRMAPAGQRAGLRAAHDALRAGRLDDALDECRKILEADPKCGDAYL